jgi:ribosomal protein S27E
MSRYLSETVVLYLMIAAIAIGVGTAIVHPEIAPGIAGLGGGLGAVLVAIGRIKRARDRTAHRADNTAQTAERTDTTNTKVRCYNCQHVQLVPVSQETFSCEQCNAQLKRHTAAANGS